MRRVGERHVTNCSRLQENRVGGGRVGPQSPLPGRLLNGRHEDVGGLRARKGRPLSRGHTPRTQQPRRYSRCSVSRSARHRHPRRASPSGHDTTRCEEWGLLSSHGRGGWCGIADNGSPYHWRSAAGDRRSPSVGPREPGAGSAGGVVRGRRWWLVTREPPRRRRRSRHGARRPGALPDGRRPPHPLVACGRGGVR